MGQGEGRGWSEWGCASAPLLFQNDDDDDDEGEGAATWEVETALHGAATIHRSAVVGGESRQDVNIALIENKARIVARLQGELERLCGIKYSMTVRFGATKENSEEGLQFEEKFLRSNNHILLPAENVTVCGAVYFGSHSLC